MLHYEILDEKRKQHLDAIKQVGVDFYLAGGTALALQLGHRDSVDFDFFAKTDIDTIALWENVQEIFAEQTQLKTQESHNTLSCVIADEIRLSFFGYIYPLIQQEHSEDGFTLASILDIGAMKLSAITSRATIKDYVDLYFILQTLSLQELLDACAQKFPALDKNLILKSLVYFEDIIDEPLMFMPGFEVSQDTVQESLKHHVQEYVGL